MPVLKLPLAWVHKRPLQRLSQLPLEQLVFLGSWFLESTEQLMNLEWLNSSVPIRPIQHQQFLHTDASATGWGAHLDQDEVSGQWTLTEKKFLINLLEMEAVARALKAFAVQLAGK